MLEMVVGRWQPSLAVAVARLILGVVMPGVVFIYGLTCILTRHAHIVTRAGLAIVTGAPAIAVGTAYAAVGLIIYVHVCWEEHPYLAGLRDVARQVLLIVVALALAAILGLMLI